jgi:hypothetical protein
MLARRSVLIALAFALVAAQLALGRNQAALLLCFLLAAFALAEIVTADRPVRYLRERLAVLTIMGLGVTALVAAPMLLTLQFAALSNRPAVGFEEAIQGSLHPANLGTLAVADVFGTHGPNYWGPGAQTLPEVRFTDDLLQLSVRRRGNDGAFSLVRHRRRGRISARSPAGHGGARGFAPLHARPLHPVLSFRLRLVAGRQPVSPAG